MTSLPSTASLFPKTTSEYKNHKKITFPRISQKDDKITKSILKNNTIIGLQGEAVIEEKNNSRNVDFLATIACTTCTCCIFETNTHAALLHLDGEDSQFNDLIPKVLKILKNKQQNSEKNDSNSSDNDDQIITCHMVGGMSSKDAIKIYTKILGIINSRDDIKLETYCIGIHSSTYVNSREESEPEEEKVIYEKVDEGGTMFFPEYVNLAFELKTGIIHKFICQKEDLECVEHQYQRACLWMGNNDEDEENKDKEPQNNRIFYDSGVHHVPFLKLNLSDNLKRFLQVLSRNPDFVLTYYSTSPHSAFFCK